MGTIRRLRRHAALVLVTTGLAVGAGCSGGARNVGHGLGEGMIDGLADKIDPADVQRRITEGLDDPAVREAVSKLAAAATSGAVAGVKEEVRREELRALAGDVAEAFGTNLAKSFKDLQLVPDLAPMLGGSIDRMLDVALAEKRQGQIEQAVVRVLESSVQSLATGLASGLRDQVGPAMGEVIGRDVGPAMGQVLSRDVGPAMVEMLRESFSPAMTEMMLDRRFQQAVQENSRAMSRGMVLGSNDALAILDQTAEARGNKSFLDTITDFQATETGIMLFLAIAQTVLLFALAAAITRGSRRVDHIGALIAMHETELAELLRSRSARRSALGDSDTPRPPDEGPVP